MLKALIVDDEQLARRGLEIRLAKFQDIEICAQSRNGREALEAVREHAPDIMFLDVQMPGMDGFDVLRSLSLLKPINDDRLAAAIERARLDSDEKRANEHRSKLLKFVCDLTGQELTLEAALQAASGNGGQSYPKRLAIRDGAETTCVNVDEIDWIDAAGDYMCVHAGGHTHVLRGTMQHLEELLDPGVFVRVHRSAIVNRNRVKSMRPHRNGEYFLSLDGDTELKLSRKYKKNIERIAHRST
jgi:two-component system LytT family response regulator